MPEDVSSVQPLTGGVASDIAAVDFDGRKVCIKFALSKLRVADDWHASVDRNRAEYAWLEFAGRVVPGSVPELFGRDADLNGFAMEFLKGEDIYNWKTELMQRRPRPR
jgi:5-methylthioribose kinase